MAVEASYQAVLWYPCTLTNLYPNTSGVQPSQSSEKINMPEEELIQRIGVQIYGVAMQQAAAKGDLAKMKEIAAQAQRFVTEYGDVSAALEALKIEIAKLEARGH